MVGTGYLWIRHGDMRTVLRGLFDENKILRNSAIMCDRNYIYY